MAASFLTLAFFLQAAAQVPAVPRHENTEIDELAAQQVGADELAVPNVAPAAKGANPTLVQQLPPTLDAPAEQGKGEGTLVRGDERKTLAGEVARTAELMRQRGQQPTPEALAREIGPDALASYLDQDTSAVDSYSVPKPESGPHQTLPDGGGAVVILPASRGS